MIFLKRVVFLVMFCCLGNAFASDLEGQIFIVTKGQQTIRLPLVSVALVPQKKFKEFVDVGIKGSVAGIKEITDQVEVKRAAVNALKDSIIGKEPSVEINPFVEFDELSSVCPVASEGASTKALELCFRTEKGKAAMDRMLALTRLYREYFDQRKQLFREMAGLMDKHRFESKAIRLMILSAGAADSVTAKSDVDGRFSFQGVTPGSYVAIARANRSVGDTAENYEWVVEVNVKSKGKNLLVLANDNLVGESCSVCIRFTGSKTYPPLGTTSNPSLVHLR